MSTSKEAFDFRIAQLPTDYPRPWSETSQGAFRERLRSSGKPVGHENKSGRDEFTTMFVYPFQKRVVFKGLAMPWLFNACVEPGDAKAHRRNPDPQTRYELNSTPRSLMNVAFGATPLYLALPGYVPQELSYALRQHPSSLKRILAQRHY